MDVPTLVAAQTLTPVRSRYQDDDLWMYDAALRTARRVTQVMKTMRQVGSRFARTTAFPVAAKKT